MRRRLETLAGTVVCLCACVGALPAGGAIAAQGTGPEGRQADIGPQGLIARLAVLRRPQTAADVLPASLHWVLPAPDNGPIIPSLTRLVATAPGVQMFVVVTKPSTVKGAFWSARFGDQAAIVAVTTAGATESFGRPAADLSDGLDVGPAGVTSSRPRPGAALYAAGIVPDGVATVHWTFADRNFRPEASVDLAVSNNVAYLPVSQIKGPLLSVRWYAADGTLVPTSDRARKQVVAAREAARRALILREDAHIHYRPSRAILAAFSVFSVHSRTGVRVAGGLTISTPPLRTLPLPILALLRPRPSPNPTQPVPQDMRQVTTRSGYRIWVVPGRRGLCVFVLDPPLPGGGEGGGGSCSGTITNALKYGGGLSGGGPQGTFTVRVLPIAHPTMILRSRNGHRRAIRPPYGIYVARSSHRLSSPH